LDTRILVNNRDNRVESNTHISDENGIIPSEVLFARTFDEMSSDNYNMNLHYGYRADRTSSLSADISFGKYYSGTATWQPNEYFTGDGIDFLRSVEDQYETNTDIDIFSAQVDYEKQLGRFTLSGGSKYSSIQTDNRLAYYDLTNGEPEVDIYRSNDFSYLENIVAFYFMLNTKLTQKINVNAGFRVENTASLGELTSAYPSEDDVVPRNYTSFFPNVSASYDDQEKHAVSLSIGRRITRPNYQDLNPFESKMSEISSWKGNPFLRPNYIMNYQLSYAFKRKLVISNTYSVTTDFFATIFEVVDEKASILIPRNMQKVTNNGLSISYPLKVTEWWNFSSFLIYNHERYNGDLEGTIIDLKANIVNFRMQNNLQLPFGIVVELTYMGGSPWIWRGTINVEEYHRVNVGLKKEFLNNNLLIQITGTDILRTSSDYYYNNNYGGMITDGVRTFDNQRFGFSLTYKFGNQKANSRQRSSAMDEELKRISD
ncbi:MAG: outer membrane beta-barrel family protein, partial [Bacteroidales bacterium]